MPTKRATTKTTPPAATRRRVKVAANVRAFYQRAAYTTPRVALDDRHAAALRRYMKRAGLGVSDAIRAAILSAAAAGKKPAATKRSAVKNHSGSRS